MRLFEESFYNGLYCVHATSRSHRDGNGSDVVARVVDALKGRERNVDGF